MLTHCSPQGNFNFLKLYFCDFDNAFGSKGRFFAFAPVGCLFLFIAMYNLSSTTDVYLTPALETMTLKFKLSDSLAGVTLLAFGNGAADVFSSIAAGGDNAIKCISIVMGGTFYITSIVVALSTFASNLSENPNDPPIREIKVTPRFFIRDIAFYTITCLYLLIVMLGVQYFNIFLSLGLLVIYGIYIVVVVYQSKEASKETDEDKEEKMSDKKANRFQNLFKKKKKE